MKKKMARRSLLKLNLATRLCRFIFRIEIVAEMELRLWRTYPAPELVSMADLS
jgi:hypothetical protein